jgi:hypothetical protein
MLSSWALFPSPSQPTHHAFYANHITVSLRSCRILRYILTTSRGSKLHNDKPPTYCHVWGSRRARHRNGLRHPLPCRTAGGREDDMTSGRECLVVNHMGIVSGRRRHCYFVSSYSY